jgi:regulation of enolase protein 1 (concanavalin A-like superfamily)
LRARRAKARAATLAPAIGLVLAGQSAYRRRVTSETPAAANPLGLFDAHNDIGAPALAGSARYDPATGIYALTGAGTNMWDVRDECHFLWTRVAGDFVIEARVSLAGLCSEKHRKAGCMARSTGDDNAAYADAAIHGDGLTALQFRRVAGGVTEHATVPVKGAAAIRFERRGDTFRFLAAAPGEPFLETAVADIALGETVYVGLFVCSHHAHTLEQATFQDVRLQHMRA